MLTNMKEEIKKAQQNKYAIPQVNINNLEWTKYILEECEFNKNPIILGVTESAITHMGGYNTVVNMVKGLMKDLNITVPVSIHLDHGSSIESCKKAIDAGFTSVMIDSSRKSIEENINDVEKVIKYACKKVAVEAEVGPISVKKDNNMYTNIKECVKISKSQIDLLAVSIGNKHGVYDGQVNLDFDLLNKITSQVQLPIVLHGASGINNKLLRKCIENGITKININTDLQIAWAQEVRRFLNNNQTVYDPRKIISSGEVAIKKIIKEKIELFNLNR